MRPWFGADCHGLSNVTFEARDLTGYSEAGRWETAEKYLDEAGFTSVERHVLPNDPMNVWFVARK